MLFHLKSSKNVVFSCFSFFANKTFTCGEGGMLVTNSKKLAEKARDLKNLSYGKINKFIHDDVGFNYRLPNISAAIGLGQFNSINKIFNEKNLPTFFTFFNLLF